jgi:hypothetical protein
MVPFFVWLVDPNIMFERDWLYDLCAIGGHTTVNQVYEKDMDLVYPGAVVVFNHSVDYNTYLLKYESQKVPFVAIHLSDETLGDDVGFYHLGMCKHIFRTYYHPMVSKYPHVTTIGLGYKTGFTRIQVSTEYPRFYHWCFAGNLHSASRLSQVVSYCPLFPYYLHTTMDGFSSKDGLTVDKYKHMLLSSKFALCPQGQGNLDTFRFYEALEAGCIPVVLRETAQQPSYWQHLFECDDLPFITGDTLEDTFDQMRRALYHGSTYASMAIRTKEFWDDTKRKWGTNLCKTIEACLTP